MLLRSPYPNWNRVRLKFLSSRYTGLDCGKKLSDAGVRERLNDEEAFSSLVEVTGMSPPLTTGRQWTMYGDESLLHPPLLALHSDVVSLDVM